MAEQLICEKWPKSFSTRTCAGTPYVPQNCNGCQAPIICPSASELLSQDQMNGRGKYLDDIRGAIHKQQAALVLGAGISVPSQMPMWNALISKMMGYAIEWDLLQRYHGCNDKNKKEEIKRELDLARRLIKKEISLLGGVNTLESAEYVAMFFDDFTAEMRIREELPETAIHTMIARMIDESWPPEKLFNHDAPPGDGSLANRISVLGEEAVAKLNTMFAVSYLMSADNGIRQAITYNYDPLVQEHMMCIYAVDPSHITTHPGKWNPVMGTGDLREIYHVHGFVSGDRHRQKKLKNVYPDESGPLVLSEDSYYRIEQREAYNWSSSIQSYFLNKYNCIFVGFSAEDYNFRRILRQKGDNVQDSAKEDKPKHYLILTINDWVRDTFKTVCSAYWDEHDKTVLDDQEQITKDTKCLLQHILDSREKYWRRFGIIPIWVTVKDIPELLTNLLTP